MKALRYKNLKKTILSLLFIIIYAAEAFDTSAVNDEKRLQADVEVDLNPDSAFGLHTVCRAAILGNMQDVANVDVCGV